MTIVAFFRKPPQSGVLDIVAEVVREAQDQRVQPQRLCYQSLCYLLVYRQSFDEQMLIPRRLQSP